MSRSGNSAVLLSLENEKVVLVVPAINKQIVFQNDDAGGSAELGNYSADELAQFEEKVFDDEIYLLAENAKKNPSQTLSADELLWIYALVSEKVEDID